MELFIEDNAHRSRSKGIPRASTHARVEFWEIAFDFALAR